MFRSVAFLSLWVTCAFAACPYDPVNTLQSLNEGFHEVYDERKKLALEKLPVVIIAMGDTLVLHAHGERAEVKYQPALYHRYKEISHIPILIYLAMEGKRELRFERLHAVRMAIIPLQGALKQDLLEGGDTDSSIALLNKCDEFIEQVLSCQIDVSSTEFFNQLGPLLLKNAEEAAYLQLDALNHQVQKWKKRFVSKDWNRIAVVVVGPQMPRIGEVTMQYFSRLTGKRLEKLPAGAAWLENAQPIENEPNKAQRRLVYAEGLKTEAEALNLLATHIIDEEIGRVFFGDEVRMQCDLLSEAASKRLMEKCDHH